MKLGQLIVDNRASILGLTVLLAIAGLWSARAMPVAIFPEVAFHRVTVIGRTGALPIEQTLTGLTQPLENALRSVLGVQIIRSSTNAGGVQVDLLFGWGDDMQRALQLVNAAVEETRVSLPPGTEIEARLLDTSAFPITGIAVTSKTKTQAELSDLVIYEVAPHFRTIPGVHRIELNGAKLREYTLTLDPDSVVQHRLELATIEAAIRSANQISAVGLVRDGYHLVLSVAEGQATSPTTLLNAVVADEQGVPVKLGDIARIDASVREDFTRAAADGQTAVLLGVSRQPAANTLAISKGVHDTMAILARDHPDCRFSIFYDQADIVRDAIGSVRDSIAAGICLAVVMIFLFIRDLRATFVAAAVIPATVFITCIALNAAHMSFNLMTLGGIAAGIGLVLDDAIVVVENLDRHQRSGKLPLRAMLDSVAEVTRPLLGSTLAPVAVLLPLGLLTAVPGDFFRPLAFTMSVALLVSLLLALTFTPALVGRMERARTVDDGVRSSGVGHRLAGIYGSSLRVLLHHHWLAALGTTAMLLVGCYAYNRVETGFIPEMDEGSFVLDYWSPPGTSLEETLRMLASVDRILQDTPEVAAFSRRTGAELGFFLTEANRGDYAIRLRPAPRRAINAIMDDVRDRIAAQIPGLRIEIVQILQDMIGDLSGSPNPIEIKLFGQNQQSLERAAVAINQRLEAVTGVVDNFDGITRIGSTARLLVSERPAHLVGLDAASVQHWLETAVTGTLVGQVIEGDRAIPLRLRYPDAYHESLELLHRLTLVAPQGKLAPLSSIATIEGGPQTVQRARENLRQLVRITARLSGRDLGSATREVKDAVAQVAIPAGVSVEYGGLYASQQRSFVELALVALASVAMVAALLLVEFGSFAAVVAIVAGSALALSGSFVALWLTRTALNVSSLVGVIMVFGIVSKNGILLLDVATHDSVTRLEDALVNAGRLRLRPILMTTSAAVAGLLPLAFGFGAGGQMQQPLAVAVVGGVSLSMVFSLLAVPIFYHALAQPRRWNDARIAS